MIEPQQTFVFSIFSYEEGSCRSFSCHHHMGLETNYPQYHTRWGMLNGPIFHFQSTCCILSLFIRQYFLQSTMLQAYKSNSPNQPHTCNLLNLIIFYQNWFMAATACTSAHTATTPLVFLFLCICVHISYSLLVVWALFVIIYFMV